MSDLAVMTLLHARHQCILPIYKNLRLLTVAPPDNHPARTVHWHITLNRPTVAVLDHLDRVLSHPRPAVPVTVRDVPFTPLGDTERFIELRQWQYAQLPPTRWGVIWDDDHVLSDIDEARAVLDTDADLVYATKLFFWDDDEHYTTHIPPHRSVFFFRRLPGDSFPGDRGIHAPRCIHDTAKQIVDLRAPLLDYGYMAPLDRDRCWRDYKRVGKIDAATLALVQPPHLHTWTGIRPLRAPTR